MDFAVNYAAGMFFIWFVYGIVLGCMCLVALVIDLGVAKLIDILIDKWTR